MNVQQLQELAAKILPGFGAFGKDPKSCLNLAVGRQLDQLVITIASPDPEFLNLHAPEIYNADGEVIARSEIYKEVLISSQREGFEVEDLLSFAASGNMLHSAKEYCPTLVVRLKKPIFVSRLSIPNRDGIYHKRSQHISVRAYRGGLCCWSYDNMEANKHIEALKSLAQAVEFELPKGDEVDIGGVALRLKNSIFSAANSGTLNLQYDEMLALLPMYGQVRDPDDYEQTICAAMVLSRMGPKGYAGTRDLRFLSQFLHSDMAIEAVQRRACRIASQGSEKPRQVTMSKHHVHFARLIERRDAHLDALDRIFEVFGNFDIPLVLCYGTLLGAVREDSFLAHDDDVDLLYFDGSTSFEQVVENQKVLIQKLNEASVRCGAEAKGTNFHVSLGGVSLDLFPSWRQGGELHLIMQQMRWRPIDADIVFPIGSSTIHGRRYSAPGNAEKFLVERYGDSWVVPDPFYGWPWKVERTVRTEEAA